MVTAEQIAVPTQDRIGGDDQVQLPKLRPWELVEEGGEEGPIGPGEAGLVDLALQDGELVA